MLTPIWSLFLCFDIWIQTPRPKYEWKVGRKQDRNWSRSADRPITVKAWTRLQSNARGLPGRWIWSKLEIPTNWKSTIPGTYELTLENLNKDVTGYFIGGNLCRKNSFEKLLAVWKSCQGIIFSSLRTKRLTWKLPAITCSWKSWVNYFISFSLSKPHDRSKLQIQAITRNKKKKKSTALVFLILFVSEKGMLITNLAEWEKSEEPEIFLIFLKLKRVLWNFNRKDFDGFLRKIREKRKSLC